MKKIILSIISTTALLMGGCGEESSFLTNIAPSDGAKVKFFHAAPDAPGVAIFVNDKKVSGVLTVAPATPGVITYGSAFPSIDYAVIPAGAAKVQITAPSLNNAVVMQGDVPLESGKYYSVFATGLAPAYAPVVAVDNIPEVSGNKIFVRFANLIGNSTDAEISIAGTSVIKSLSAGKVSEFVAYELPNYTTGTQNVSLTAKVNGTVPVTSNITLSSISPNRVVTFILRGLLADKAGTTSKYPLAVSFYNNR